MKDSTPYRQECKVLLAATITTLTMDDDLLYTSPKRTQLAGAATYGTKFKLEWISEFPSITKGRISFHH